MVISYRMWDLQADVLVIGFGGAGAAAAITAHDSGAGVLVLEKNAEGGGNTRLSAGVLLTFEISSQCVDFLDRISEGATDRETLERLIRESPRNIEWLTSLGGRVAPSPPYPGYPGATFP